MKIYGLIQARMSSVRLPGKILAPIVGIPLLGVIVARVSGSRVDQWGLATTTRQDDDVTAAWGEELGLQVFRGPDEDVLARFAGALRKIQATAVVRLTADNPFVNSEIVDLLVEDFVRRPRGKIVVGGAAGYFPLGYVPQIADAEAVVRLEESLSQHEVSHRSHVLSSFYAEGLSHEIAVPAGWPARPHWRWTVDTLDDLTMARAAFDCFGEDWRSMSYIDMVQRLDTRPDITQCNVHVRQKTAAEG